VGVFLVVFACSAGVTVKLPGAQVASVGLYAVLKLIGAAFLFKPILYSYLTYVLASLFVFRHHHTGVLSWNAWKRVGKVV
jgi:hypothetical protein